MARHPHYRYIPDSSGRTARRTTVTPVWVRRVVVLILLLVATLYGGPGGFLFMLLFLALIGHVHYRNKPQTAHVHSGQTYRE